MVNNGRSDKEWIIIHSIKICLDLIYEKQYENITNLQLDQRFIILYSIKIHRMDINQFS